ncbi:MAG: hypothetical protein KGH84_14080, partial [Paracoccaceae bacterium]|nr:hypothetical protein [Paracoccaceae bacterium]
ISNIHPSFTQLLDILQSGAASDVATDFNRHKFRYGKIKDGTGYCAVLDGDMLNKPEFVDLASDVNAHFILPYEAPEKFLVSAYLNQSPSPALYSFMQNDNHHAAFGKMVELNLATDKSDARNLCFNAFRESAGYSDFFDGLRDFLMGVVSRFSDPEYHPS